MRFFRLTILPTVLAFSFSALAKVSQMATDQYEEVFKDIAAFSEGQEPDDVLVVFDIDETLLVVQDCLAPGESEGFAGWLKKVFECPADLTEELIVDEIADLQKKDYATMALTARDDDLVEPTERELHRHDIGFLNAPLSQGDNFEETFGKKSKILLKDGIVYASGRNKGETLKIVLERVGRPYQSIVFIDDNKKNVGAMAKAYRDDANVHVRIIHYTRYDH